MKNQLEIKCQNPPGFDLDFHLVAAFEQGLDLECPQKSRIPCRVLGYGEISTVIEILLDQLAGLAFKRMSIFESNEEIEAYLRLYRQYNLILSREVTLSLPPSGYLVCESVTHRPIFYIIQRQVPYYTLGNKAINLLPHDESLLLIQGILAELLKVWAYNLNHPDCQVAIDGQVSNWSLQQFDPENPHYEPGTALLYLDTSSPFLRLKQVEQLDAELFLRAAPSFMVWILRWLFLNDVMNRYYDPRKVTIDLLANMYKEQRPDLVPELVCLANAFFAGPAQALNLVSLEEKEIQDYYREDALIWSLYLSMRRFDHFLKRSILQREYPYILPGKIIR